MTNRTQRGEQGRGLESGSEEGVWTLWRSGLAPCDEQTGRVLGQWKLPCVCVCALHNRAPHLSPRPGHCGLEDLQEDLFSKEQLKPLCGDLWREGFYGKG